MNIFCPNRHGSEPTTMALDSHSWSYKDGKPIRILYQFRCPICQTVLRTGLPIIYYKEVSDENQSGKQVSRYGKA